MPRSAVVALLLLATAAWLGLGYESRSVARQDAARYLAREARIGETRAAADSAGVAAGRLDDSLTAIRHAYAAASERATRASWARMRAALAAAQAAARPGPVRLRDAPPDPALVSLDSALTRTTRARDSLAALLPRLDSVAAAAAAPSPAVDAEGRTLLERLRQHRMFAFLLTGAALGSLLVSEHRAARG